ncbi:MAG: hypothetical protein J0M26_06380 [Planctomycetes bacterium]|nr:hypothetical protein [Planctomycetota bacterium]
MKSGEHAAVNGQKSLGPRDRAILDCVCRYRVITNEMIQKQFLAGLQMNAVTKVSSRLADNGWLTRHNYLMGRLYFSAGKKLCTQESLPFSRTRPLGLQSLAISMATAEVCLLVNDKIRLLSQEDLSRDWNWIPKHHRSMVYASFSQVDMKPTLFMLRFDLGGTSQHIVSKCFKDWKTRCGTSGFKSLMEHKRFVQIIVTTSERKKANIAEDLKRKDWPVGTRFEFVLSKELENILFHAS